jgi:hypothetical protein
VPTVTAAASRITFSGGTEKGLVLKGKRTRIVMKARLIHILMALTAIGRISPAIDL